MEWTQIIVAAITAFASIAAAVIAKRTGKEAKKTAETAEKTSVAVVDLMRNEITKIYYKRQDVGELYEYERQSLDKMYQGYHEAGGNSFVDDIYAQMRKWKVIGSGKQIGSGKEDK